MHERPSRIATSDDAIFPALNRGNVSHAHAVQFYDGAGFLAETVADFFTEGVLLGQPALAVATPSHRRAIGDALSARGIDVKSAVKAGTLTMLDARETMSTFLTDGFPDRARFRAAIGRIIGRSRGASVILRVFGEMVDVLWRDGQAAATIALEVHWNELLAEGGVDLLCAYDLGGFADAGDAEAFAHICAAHHHVRPTEAYSRASDASRLVEISTLQQRAKALETELRQRAVLEQRLRDALEQRERLLLEERTARAESERARILAEEANRAKSTFLAVMSHELRTPLNAIGGYAELIGMGVFGPVSQQQEDALGRLQQSQRHLLGMIDQVLGYVQADSGTLPYHITDIRVSDVLESVAAQMGPQMRARGINFSTGRCDPGLTARADLVKLQQILVNLLSNALKFTPSGGDVWLEAECTGRAAVIRVRDTGIGVPAADLNAIFEPFVQRDSAFTRVQGGIGLGLAIGRDLARGMHGDLTVRSEPGQGSVFAVSVPLGA